ncbi:MAG: phage holin family protein [bacterium]
MKEIENLLIYYGNRIVEHPIIKSLVAGGILLGDYLFGGFGQPLQILILLMLIDLITGISSAIVVEQGLKCANEEYTKTKDIVTSRTMRNGIWKFIEYMIAVFIANVISLQFGTESVRSFAIMWLSLTELKSIHENFYEMGFDVPLTQQLFDFADSYLEKEKKENKKK